MNTYQNSGLFQLSKGMAFITLSLLFSLFGFTACSGKTSSTTAESAMIDGFTDTVPRIHYQVEGHGPYLVMVHGFYGRLNDWRHGGWVDALKKKYTLILIDSRGFGLSGKGETVSDYSMDKRALDVLAVMDKLGVGKAHYMGYSMGGKIAFSLMGKNTERFLSYIIISAAPVQYDMDEMSALIESTFPDKWEIPASVTMTEDDMNYFRALDKQVLLDSCANSNWPNRTMVFGACKRASIVIYGENEPPEDKKCLKQTDEWSSRCTTVEMPGLDHYQLIFSADKIVPTVLKFLNKAD